MAGDRFPRSGGGMDMLVNQADAAELMRFRRVDKSFSSLILDAIAGRVQAGDGSAAPEDLAIIKQNASWTPTVFDDDGFVVTDPAHIGSTGTASGRYTEWRRPSGGGWAWLHGELVVNGSGIAFGAAGKQLHWGNFPVTFRDPAADSPSSHDYFVGAGMIGRGFGGYDTPGTLFLPPGTSQNGDPTGKHADLLIGSFITGGNATFSSSATKNVPHGLGVLPEIVLVTPFGSGQGMMTAGADNNNVLVAAGERTAGGIRTFAASATDTFNHGLGATPTGVLLTSESATTGQLTYTKTSTQITVTAAGGATSASYTWRAFLQSPATSNAFFWLVGFAGADDSIVKNDYPWLWGSGFDHFEIFAGGPTV